MPWSWRIGSIAGISIRVHFTLALLLVWIAIGHRTHGLEAMLGGVAITVAVFLIIVLHELSHALVARRFGVRTRDITLLPIGGIANMERIPDDPKQELLIAIAGPASNVVLAAALVGAARLVSDLDVRAFLATLAWINVSLAAFNLLPAFPMDGGRAARALIAMRRGRARATMLAARFGQAFAVAFAVAGLFFNPMLLFIALFVWVGAAGERSQEERREALARLSLEDVEVSRFDVVDADDTLRAAASRLAHGFQRDFPVVDDGRVVGVLTEQGLLAGIDELGADARVRAAMRPGVAVIDVHAPALEALELVGRREPIVLLVRDGRIEGMVTAEGLEERLRLEHAMRSHAA